MLLVVGNLPASRKTTSLNWMDLVIFNNFLCKDLVNIIQFDSQPFISLDGHQVHALGKKTKRLISELVVEIYQLHPWRLTWNIVMEVWKIIFLSKWVICWWTMLIFQGVHHFTPKNKKALHGESPHQRIVVWNLSADWWSDQHSHHPGCRKGRSLDPFELGESWRQSSGDFSPEKNAWRKSGFQGSPAKNPPKKSPTWISRKMQHLKQPKPPSMTFGFQRILVCWGLIFPHFHEFLEFLEVTLGMDEPR